MNWIVAGYASSILQTVWKTAAPSVAYDVPGNVASTEESQGFGIHVDAWGKPARSIEKKRASVMVDSEQRGYLICLALV